MDGCTAARPRVGTPHDIGTCFGTQHQMRKCGQAIVRAYVCVSSVYTEWLQPLTDMQGARCGHGEHRLSAHVLSTDLPSAASDVAAAAAAAVC